MTRYLGIDYGEKRIGLSYGDDLGIAMPLSAAVEATSQERWNHIARVVAERKVTDVVLGYPYNMDGSAGFKAKEVERFGEELRKRFSLPVHLVDETLTSSVAEERFRKRGRKTDRRSGEVDSHAASLILQDFLDQKYPV